MKSWLWPFSRRKSPPIIDAREDNEGWAVGDLAMCVEDFYQPCLCPKKGQVLRVAAIIESVIDGTNRLGIGLGFESLPHAWICTAFKKLRPTIEPASDEFKQELKDRLGTSAPVTTSYRPRPFLHSPTHASGLNDSPPEGTSGETGVRVSLGAANGEQWRAFFRIGGDV